MLLKYESQVSSLHSSADSPNSFSNSKKPTAILWSGFAISLILFGIGTALCLARVGGVNGMIANGCTFGAVGVIVFSVALCYFNSKKEEKIKSLENEIISPSTAVPVEEPVPFNPRNLFNIFTIMENKLKIEYLNNVTGSLSEVEVRTLIVFLAQPKKNDIKYAARDQDDAYLRIFHHLSDNKHYKKVVHNLSRLYPKIELFLASVYLDITHADFSKNCMTFTTSPVKYERKLPTLGDHYLTGCEDIDFNVKN